MRILVIRRDNIGDLVCTTPLLAMLRQAQPGADIAVLANSYNAPVLEGNTDVSRTWVYTKIKHRPAGTSALATAGRLVRTYLDIRRQRFDWAILAGGACSPALLALGRYAGARRLVGYRPADPNLAEKLDVCLDIPTELRHEVVDTAALGVPLGAVGEPGPLRVFARSPAEGRSADPVIAIALGARDEKRWPAGNFAALCEGLRSRHRRARLLILWPPGDALAATRSDDDAVAASLLGRNPDRTDGWPTATLPQLIDALAGSDLVVSVDGGAVHLAAALGKPVVGLYANRPEVYRRWYPWMVRHRVVVSPDRLVRDVHPQTVIEAVGSLAAEAGIALG